ncbi:MAG TPA: flagellin [Chloroflexota bacterium]|nr:flagellin [Chloroflexota bacterium]
MTALLDFSSLSAFSLNALRARETSFGDTVSRISSGLRLTTAGDDVAAWMMGVRLDNRARGWTEASRNIQNGLSLLETAEGGLATIGAALQRMRELSVQAANGLYGANERTAIQAEVDALRDEIYKTLDTTQFNGMQPLGGTSTFTPPGIILANLLPVTGSGASGTAATQTGTYAVNITVPAQRAGLKGTATASPVAVNTVLTITSDQGTVSVTLTPADPETNWPAIINPIAAAIGVTAEITDNTTTYDDGTLADPLNDKVLMFRTTGKGAAKSVQVTSDQFFDTTGFGNGGSTAAFGVDVQGTINGGAFTAVGRTVTAGAASAGAEGLTFTFDSDPAAGPAGTIDVTANPAVIADFTHVVQMAPNYTDEHLITIPTFASGALATSGANTLGTLDVSTQAGALAALDVLEDALTEVNAGRGAIAAHYNSLEHSLDNALGSATTTTPAQSRIVDADVAAESTALMQGQLAQQAGMQVLAALHAQSAASLEFMVNMLEASPLQAAG